MKRPYKKKQIVISCYNNQTYFLGGLLFLCVLIVAARRHLFCRSARAALPLPALRSSALALWDVGSLSPSSGGRCLSCIHTFCRRICRKYLQKTRARHQQFKSLCCCLIVSDPFFPFELKKQRWKRSHLQRRS